MRIFQVKSPICVPIVLGVCALFTFTGMGYAKNLKPRIAPSATTVVRPHLIAIVMGGRHPIAQSTITIWEVGMTGVNSATAIASTTSDSRGRFNIGVIPCANMDSQLYMTATSGIANGSAPLNPSIGLVALLGPCNKIPVNVFINELTTAVAAYVMSQFTNTPFDPNYGVNGGPGSDAYIGVNNAVSLGVKLVNSVNGVPTPFLNTAPNSPAFLNTIADILVSCVNDVAPFTVCSNLRSTVTPGVGSEPDNTWGVAATIAQNPGKNVDAIYAFLSQLPSGVPAPFTPILTSPPTDLALSVLYPIPGATNPSGLTIDHAGNVWFSDTGANAIFKVTPIGISGRLTLITGLLSPKDIFFDPTGSASVWVSSAGNNSVFQFNASGSGRLTNTNMGPGGPQGLGTDSFHQLWYANSPTSGVFFPLQATTTGRTKAVRFVSMANLLKTSYLTVDTADTANNIIWVTNKQGNGLITVVRVVNKGTNAFSATSTSIHDPFVPVNGAGGISVDNNGDVWAANTGGAIYKLRAADGSVEKSLAEGGIKSGSMPVGVATDSVNNVWVSNNNNIAEIDTNGNALSPSTGFTAGGMFAGSQPGLAIDRSGNVWATSTMSGSIGLVELVGAASPVATPRQGRPTAP